MIEVMGEYQKLKKNKNFEVFLAVMVIKYQLSIFLF